MGAIQDSMGAQTDVSKEEGQRADEWVEVHKHSHKNGKYRIEHHDENQPQHENGFGSVFAINNQKNDCRDGRTDDRDELDQNEMNDQQVSCPATQTKAAVGKYLGDHIQPKQDTPKQIFSAVVRKYFRYIHKRMLTN